MICRFWQFLFSDLTVFAKEQLLHALGGAGATRSQACEAGAATAASGAGTLQRTEIHENTPFLSKTNAENTLHLWAIRHH